MKDRIRDLVGQLAEIQDGKPWIGSCFSKKMKLVREEDFFKRPVKDMHSLAEIISHLTTWREETLVKLKTGAGNLTDDHPTNWKDMDTLKSLGRSRILQDYDRSLSDILEHLDGKNDYFLEETYFDGDFKGTYSYAWLLQGMLHHDIYHLGQIGYIVKFLKKSE